MRSSAPAPSVLQTLNATPMMDVMLVLLVTFLVVTPVIHSGPDLVLPGAVRGEPVPEHGLTIRVERDGRAQLRVSALVRRSVGGVGRAAPGHHAGGGSRSATAVPGG